MGVNQVIQRGDFSSRMQMMQEALQHTVTRAARFPHALLAFARTLFVALAACLAPLVSHAAFPNLNSFTATQGTISDAIQLDMTVPAFTPAYSYCAIQLRESGTLFTYITISNVAGVFNAASAATATVQGGPAGSRSFSARIACSNTASAVQTGGGTQIGATLNATGWKSGIPFLSRVQNLHASTGTNASGVDVYFDGFQNKEECETGVEYVVYRDGAPAGTTPHPFTATFSSAPITWTDTPVSAGDHVYTAYARCVGFPARVNASSSNDAIGFITPVARPVVSVTASDLAFTDRVDVSFSAPSQSPDCQAVSYRILRNGSLIGTVSTVPVTGGSATYQDTTANPGTVYTYGVQANCTVGNRWGPWPTPMGGGYYPPDFKAFFTAPDVSATCTAVSYSLRDRNGDHATISSVPLTGGAGQTVVWTGGSSLVVLPSSVHSTCTYPNITSSSVTDAGSRNYSTPLPATSVVASDGAYSNRVAISFTAPNQSSLCTSILYTVTRNGFDIGNSASNPLTGGALTFDDTTAVPSVVYTYGVRSICTPGSTTATSATNTGFRLGTPTAVSSVAASDGLFPGKVNVTFTAPNQSAQCSTASYVVVRDGSDIATVTTIPLTGGSGSYDDTTAAAGVHTYSVRSVCSPGGSTAASATDTGFIGLNPLAALSVTATKGDWTDIRFSATAPDQTAYCPVAPQYDVVRDGTVLTTITTIPISGGSIAYNDSTYVNPDNSFHMYWVVSRCPSTGLTTTSTASQGWRAVTPWAVSSLAATDGSFADHVALTFTGPDQHDRCSGIEYLVSRDGSQIATVSSVPLTGGAGSYNDFSASIGTHTYSVTTRCLLSLMTQASATDTGFRSGVASTPISIVASDYLYADHVSVAVQVGNDSAQCSTRDIVVARDGTDITTISGVAVSGGTGNYDDFSASFGTHTYSARSVCNPGASASASISDPGGRRGSAPPPTSLSASDGTFTSFIRLNVVLPAALECTTRSVVLAREGVDIATITTVPVAGGSASYDDTGAPFGYQNYTARSICDPGSNPSTTVTDQGIRAASAPPPTAVVASDYQFLDRVTVHVDYPAAPNCASRDIVLSRDGTDIATLSSLPLSSGVLDYDDFAAAPGSHIYGARATCAPLGAVSSTVTDTGAKKYPAAACSAVSAPTVVFFPATPTALATITGVSDAATVQVVAYGSASGTNDQFAYVASGAAGTYTATIALGNHAVGLPEYGVVNVLASVTGNNPGDLPVTCASTTFVMADAPAPTAVSATDYTLADRVRLTGTVAAAPYCTSLDVDYMRDGAVISTQNLGSPVGSTALQYDDVGGPTGVHTYGIRTTCHVGPSTFVGTPVTDPGARSYGPPVCPAVSVPQPKYGYSSGLLVPVTALNPTAYSSIRISAYGVPSGASDLTYYPLTVSGSNMIGSVNLSNHASGSPEYGTISVELLATGLDPGATEVSCAQTTFEVVQLCGAMTLTGPDGTGPLPASISWNADPAAQSYLVQHGSSPSGPWSTFGTYSPGTTSTTVPGWPREYFRVQCVASDPMGNTASPAVRVSGNPPPVVAPNTFFVNNPGMATVTPSITDPDGNTTFSLAITVPPVNGIASVVGGTIQYVPNPSFAGDDPFTVSATDPGGAVGTAVFTATVIALRPPAPTGLVATDGTLVGGVALTWNTTAYATDYNVYRRNSLVDPSPVTLGKVAGTAFTDSTGVAGTVYYYTVTGSNGATEGDPSVPDTGFADTPIAGVSVTLSTQVDAPVTASPAFTDPDPGDVPLFTIETPPANGSASVVAGKIRYTPAPGYVGIDSFTIRGTDRAGAYSVGPASATVSCLAPSLTPFGIAPTKVFGTSTYSVSTTYDTKACPHAFSLTYELLSGVSVVDSSTVALPVAAGVQPAAFERVAPSTAGGYTARITLTNTVTGSTTVVSGPLNVSVFRAPQFQWSASSYLADVDTAVLRLVPTPDCVATTDDALARSDLTKCLLEPSSLPPGVSGGPQTFNVSFSGVPSAAGSFSSSVDVSVYSPAGVKSLLATVPAPVTVLPVSSVVFSAPATVSAKMYTELYSVTPSQSSGPVCDLTTIELATSMAASGRRGCVVDWSPAPVDSYAEGNTLKGAFFTPSSDSATFTVSVVDASGNKHAASTGTVSLNPTVVNYAYTLTTAPSPVYAQITAAAVNAKSSGPDTCITTTSLPDATSQGPKICLFEWGVVDGLAQDPRSNLPSLRGAFQSAGTVSVPYTVSVIFHGAKRQILSASTDVTVLPPLPPSITLERMREIAPDVYAASTTGGPIGVLYSPTNLGQLDGSALMAGDAPVSFTMIGNKNRQVLLATPAPLYSERQLDVAVAMHASPTVNATKTITVVSVPRDGLRLRLNSPPTGAPDTAPLSVSATVVQSTGSGLEYVPAEAGQWAVTFGEVSSAGAFVPLTSPINTDATGTATGSVSLAGRNILRLSAQATPISPYPGYVALLKSFTSVISVTKGTPVAATLVSSRGLTGPAPFLGVFRLEFATLADHIANDQYRWQVSSDGGSTWNAIPDANTPQYALRLAAGTHQVKVILRNKNTLEESETPAVQVVVYNVPKVTISGPVYLLPGAAGTFAFTALDATNSPYPSPVYSWTIANASAAASDPPLASGSSSSTTFAPSAPGVYRLNVRVRDASTDQADPKAWFMAPYQFIVPSPAPLTLRISGPTRVEVGKPGSWTATSVANFNLAQSPLSLDGYWTLPDGTTSPGQTLTWTPTTADLALTSRPSIRYTGWIAGYDASTTASQSAQMSLWQYVWPNWRITRTTTSPLAPTNVQYLVLPDNNQLLAVLEGLTYTWTVPPSISVSGTPGSKLNGTISTGSTSTVEVTVADARGNTQTISDTITVDNPPPVVLDVVAQNFSRWAHAPIVLGLTAKATGGSSTDPIVLYEYYLDGVRVDTANTSTARLNLTSPATYSVEVRVTTRGGATANRTISVTVPPNVAPTCNPVATLATNRRSLALQAKCVDPDGSIVRYAWFFNGAPVPLTVGATWNTVLPLDQVFPLNVEVQVQDDGGAVGSGTATVN